MTNLKCLVNHGRYCERFILLTSFTFIYSTESSNLNICYTPSHKNNLQNKTKKTKKIQECISFKSLKIWILPAEQTFLIILLRHHQSWFLIYVNPLFEKGQRSRPARKKTNFITFYPNLILIYSGTLLTEFSIQKIPTIFQLSSCTFRCRSCQSLHFWILAIS